MKKYIILLFPISLFVISSLSAQIIGTIAGNGTWGFSGDGGQATAAQLFEPYGVAVDGSGNVFIADPGNNRIRKVNTIGIITTIAGNGAAGYLSDGGQATAAELNFPTGIAVDGSGNVFIADQNNNRIRKVNATGIITTFAGNGTSSFSGDGGQATAAALNGPTGVTVDRNGNVYIADWSNARVRKVNTSGIISTYAGNGGSGYSGDGGQATAAELYPHGLATDSSNNVYIADYNNHAVRKVNTSGVISTFAGNGLPAYSGDGGQATAAQLYYPNGVAIDGNGNVYIADQDNNRIRKVNASGIITTFAGNGTFGYSGDGGQATAAEFWNPFGVAADGCGNLYIADHGNFVIRSVASGILPPTVGTITGISSVCVGVSITLSDVPTGGVWTVTNGNASISGGVVTGVTSGVDTIKYSVTNTCGTAIATKTITVNPLPVAGTITGSSSVCVSSTIALTGTTGGTWSSGTTSVATVGSATGIVTGVSAGTIIISNSVTNACGTATTTKTITVNPLPVAGTITGLPIVCVGSLISLSDAAPGGAWSATNANATVSGGLVTGVAAGIDTIKYTVTNTCGTAIASYPVTINSLPNAGTISGVSIVCTGAAITFIDPALGGLWSTTNGNAAVSGGIVTGVTSGVDTILYIVINSCGAATASKTATINPSPNAGTITGASLVCAGAAITLTDPTVGGIWSSANSNATVTGGIVTGVTAGTDTIKYTVANSCGTAVASKIITINPLPNPGTITGLSMVCIGSSITLTDLVTGGIWSATNGNAIVSSGGAVFGVTAGIDTINYSVANSCGTTTAMKAVTVNALPNAGIITGTSSVCISSSMTIADTATGGIWSVTNGNATVAGGAVGGIVTGITVGTDTINYTVTNSCGTAIVTRIIAIDPLPSAGTITGSDTVCMFTSVTLADTTSGGVWSTATGAATVSSAGVVIGINYGPDTVLYTVTNSCGSAVAGFPVFVLQPGDCNVGVHMVSNPAEGELKVYPNPNDGTFTVNLSSNTEEAVYYVVTNMLGEKVKEVTSSTNKPSDIKLDASPGIYFLNAITPQGKWLEKITIIR